MSGMLCICGSTSSAAHDIVGNIVDLLAILLEHGWAGCGARISAENYTALEDDAGDGRPCFAGLRWRVSPATAELERLCQRENGFEMRAALRNLLE